jgi:hypothetical protein
VFLPWPQEGVIANGVYNSTARATQQSAWNTFLSAMATANKQLQVASYVHANSNYVTAALVESNAATQRLRQPR